MYEIQIQFDTPRQAVKSDAAKTLKDRQAAVTALFLDRDNQSELNEAIYEAHPSKQLLATDTEAILQTLAEQLAQYTGPIEPQPFLRWAIGFVTGEAASYKTVTDILSEHGSLIKRTIRSELWRFTRLDIGVSGPEDIFQEISTLIFEKTPSLNRRGTARLTTRLVSLVKRHVYFYHNKPNWERLKLVEQFPTHWRCTHLSTEERASNRFEEGEADTVAAPVDFG